MLFCPLRFISHIFTNVRRCTQKTQKKIYNHMSVCAWYKAYDFISHCSSRWVIIFVRIYSWFECDEKMILGIHYGDGDTKHDKNAYQLIYIGKTDYFSMPHSNCCYQFTSMCVRWWYGWYDNNKCTSLLCTRYVRQLHWKWVTKKGVKFELMCQYKGKCTHALFISSDLIKTASPMFDECVSFYPI